MKLRIDSAAHAQNRNFAGILKKQKHTQKQKRAELVGKNIHQKRNSPQNWLVKFWSENFVTLKKSTLKGETYWKV
jgi:hypothetical protein